MLSLIQKKTKVFSRLRMILLVLAVSVYLLIVLSYSFGRDASNVSRQMNLILETILRRFKADFYETSLLNLLIYIAVTLFAGMGLFSLVVSMYKKGPNNFVGNVTFKRKAIGYQGVHVRWSLFIRERERFFQTPVYLLNTTMFLIMAVIFVFLVLISRHGVSQRIALLGTLLNIPSDHINILYIYNYSIYYYV